MGCVLGDSSAIASSTNSYGAALRGLGAKPVFSGGIKNGSRRGAGIRFRILGFFDQDSRIVMDRVRIDKWLWAARFFKTRSLASHACELGRIESNGQRVKAAREVRVGDLLLVKNDSGDF